MNLFTKYARSCQLCSDQHSRDYRILFYGCFMTHIIEDVTKQSTVSNRVGQKSMYSQLVILFAVLPSYRELYSSLCSYRIVIFISGWGFSCQICGRVYRRSNALAAHKRTHEGVTICSICGAQISTVHNLRHHLRMVHRLSTEEAKQHTAAVSGRRGRLPSHAV